MHSCRSSYTFQLDSTFKYSHTVSRPMPSCDKCVALCCKYITVELAVPKNRKAWDEIRWMLMHENIIVYQDLDGDWIAEFRTKCKHLYENKCSIYESRPQVCRDHHTHECEANPEPFAKVIFTKPEQVDEYLKKNKS